MNPIKSDIQSIREKEKFTLEDIYLEDILVSQDAVWLAQRRRSWKWNHRGQ